MIQTDPHPDFEDDLAFIRRLMDGARKATADHSEQLIFWGFLLAAAEGLTYLVREGVFQVSIAVIWLVVVGVGSCGSSLLGHRTLRQAPVNSLADRHLSAIWIGCGLSCCCWDASAKEPGRYRRPLRWAPSVFSSAARSSRRPCFRTGPFSGHLRPRGGSWAPCCWSALFRLRASYSYVVRSCS